MRNKTLKYHLPLVLWALLILYLSVTPGNELPKFSFWQHDKIFHFIFYRILSVFAKWSLYRQYSFSRLRLRENILIILSISAFSIMIEILQGKLINGRYFDIFDIPVSFENDMESI